MPVRLDRRGDGTIEDVFLDYVLQALFEPDGSVSGIFAHAVDITDQVQAREALRESEERFRALVTASSDVVNRMSPDWSEMPYPDVREFMADTHEPSSTWLEKYIHPVTSSRKTDPI